MNVSGLRKRNYWAEDGVRLKFELSSRPLPPTMRAAGNDVSAPPVTSIGAQYLLGGDL